MDDASLTSALERAERALAEGRTLQSTGFWKAVGHLRRHPEVAARYAGRVGEIDRKAFEAGVKVRVPLWAGNLLLFGGSAAGLVLLLAAPRFEGILKTLVFLGGFVALLVCTHSPTHYLVGRLVGIRFTHYFLGGPPPPRPGAKVDYASYLVTPPKRRALMHASGAVVTKLVPFALIPAGMAIEVEFWGLALLAVVGAGQILTDLLLSTKTSDWMKVKRELRAGR